MNLINIIGWLTIQIPNFDIYSYWHHNNHDCKWQRNKFYAYTEL